MTNTPSRLADAQSFATVRLIEQARSRAATALEPLLRTHLVVRFRHLHPVSEPVRANVGIMRTTSKLMILVELLNLTLENALRSNRGSSVKFAPLAELGNAAILLLTRKPDPQTWTPDEHLAYIIATRDFSDVMAARRERAPDDATPRSDAAGRSQSDTDLELIEEIPF